ncbi:ABC transporter permease [Amycolatopsis jiangsuensis]|uniref:ABC-2 type transport system permease protein n=1 Tax=Amycolatopsis jiangsuensis TaxID=1181879 RepID=A0A840IXG5_9PSEU|nr:ABC transporter permease [Amycolatopsis jiangsuensis]MBB4687326.1 ABC-2 type transport system permease protein [Amycolatopsis jiangsuensis]
MNLLAVERIKLFTTRSPWWCALIAVVVTAGFGAMLAGASSDQQSLSVGNTQFSYQFGLAVIMVLAALSVTTEYRFGTIRTTFQAVPNRASVLLAKATVVGAVALVIGEIGAFGSWGLSYLIRPQDDLALDSAADWINVAGVGVLAALAAVIAVSVGVLLRHSAGALALLLIYVLAVENLVQLIPTFGDKIHRWLPFNVADKFLSGGSGVPGGRMSEAALSQGWSLVYFAGFAVLMLAIAIGVAKKRDA